jgi:hypothetical protein
MEDDAATLMAPSALYDTWAETTSPADLGKSKGDSWLGHILVIRRTPNATSFAALSPARSVRAAHVEPSRALRAERSPCGRRGSDIGGDPLVRPASAIADGGHHVQTIDGKTKQNGSGLGPRPRRSFRMHASRGINWLMAESR